MTDGVFSKKETARKAQIISRFAGGNTKNTIIKKYGYLSDHFMKCFAVDTKN